MKFNKENIEIKQKPQWLDHTKTIMSSCKNDKNIYNRINKGVKRNKDITSNDDVKRTIGQ